MIITKRNQQYLTANNDAHAIWFNFMEDMIAQGWRVLGSGDGVSFENQGQKVLGASWGRIVVPVKASLVDGETFTIDDGAAPVTFEFDTVPDGVGGGNVVVDISATVTEFDVRDAIISAINGSALGITASAAYRRQPTSGSWGDPLNTAAVLLQNNATGAGGNTTSSETVTSSSFTISDMTGGGIAAGGSGGVYHLFTSAPTPLDSTNPWTSGAWGNYVPFPAFDGASWIRLATPADADHYTEFVFQVIFDSNPGKSIQILMSVCKGAQRFDQGATAWQRPGVNTGVAMRPEGGIFTDDPEGHSSHGILAINIDLANGYAHWFVGDKSVDYDFMYSATRGDTHAMTSVFMRFRTVGGQVRSDGSPDPDPYVLVAADTGNLMSGSGLLRAREVAPPRLEDLVVSAFNVTTMLVTYGVDDPGISASNQGHYGAAFVRPASEDSFGTQGFWENAGRNHANNKVTIDTAVGVGLSTTDVDATFRFHKGFLKNDLFGFPSKFYDNPAPLKGPTPADAYMAKGYFAWYWGAEERLLP